MSRGERKDLTDADRSGTRCGRMRADERSISGDDDRKGREDERRGVMGGWEKMREEANNWSKLREGKEKILKMWIKVM